MYYYLLINLASIIIPIIAGFDSRLKFHKKWKFLFPALISTMLIFIPWDIIKTDLGVWGFNPKYIMGVYFINLPIEELLFFIAIPYACIFTYHALALVIKSESSNSVFNNLSLLIGISLSIIAVLNHEKTYTFVTFLATGIFLIAHRFLLKPVYIAKFYFSFLVILLPFFIVDGALTGLFTVEPVVWYDNSENLGIRLSTIPVEDFVYGLLLLLMNTTIYESLQKWSVRNQYQVK
ncbi:MAG TPA: lycopene cyclase domain-containing protein [Lentimicrobium sp.]|nr:lycopene cyclase domain-containing protein [Lentimicrobium sp.]